MSFKQSSLLLFSLGYCGSEELIMTVGMLVTILWLPRSQYRIGLHCLVLTSHCKLMVEREGGDNSPTRLCRCADG